MSTICSVISYSSLTPYCRKQDGPKRQRTSSASPSPLPEQQQTTSQVDSDDGANARSTGSKKIRGAAARNHREKELREEKERARQDAKMKREGRAERRRVYGECAHTSNLMFTYTMSRFGSCRRVTSITIICCQEHRNTYSVLGPSASSCCVRHSPIEPTGPTQKRGQATEFPKGEARKESVYKG